MVFFGLADLLQEHLFGAVSGPGHKHRGRDLAIVVRGEGTPSDVGGDQFPFLEFTFHLSMDLAFFGFTHLEIFRVLHLLIDSHATADLFDVIIVLLKREFVGHPGFHDLLHLGIDAGGHQLPCLFGLVLKESVVDVLLGQAVILPNI